MPGVDQSAADAATVIGDATDFGEVYREHLPAVLRYLRRRLGHDAGEDAAHDVFVRAFDRRSTYDPVRAPLIAWIFGIAANVIADHHRQESRRLRALEQAEREPGVDQNAPRERQSLSPGLVAAVRRLSRTDRETFLLLVWGELTYEEVAAAMQIPVGTVRSRVARVRTKLQSATPPTDGERSGITEKGSAHV